MEQDFFGSFQWEMSWSNMTSENLILLRMSIQKFMFLDFFKAIFDTSFRPLCPFFGKWNDLYKW